MFELSLLSSLLQAKINKADKKNIFLICQYKLV
jgi:hypothetical protein